MAKAWHPAHHSKYSHLQQQEKSMRNSLRHGSAASLMASCRHSRHVSRCQPPPHMYRDTTYCSRLTSPLDALPLPCQRTGLAATTLVGLNGLIDLVVGLLIVCLAVSCPTPAAHSRSNQTDSRRKVTLKLARLQTQSQTLVIEISFICP